MIRRETDNGFTQVIDSSNVKAGLKIYKSYYGLYNKLNEATNVEEFNKSLQELLNILDDKSTKGLHFFASIEDFIDNITKRAIGFGIDVRETIGEDRFLKLFLSTFHGNDDDEDT